MRNCFSKLNSHGTQMRGILLLFVFIMGLSISVTMMAKEKKADIYDPALDVKTAITSALKQAQKQNKHVLLMFGGNWCPWCHMLHELFKSNKTINQFLSDNYILIMVDVGEKANKPLNRDLVDQMGVKDMGYPSIAVLGKKGERLVSQNSGILEKGRGHDPERIMGFLKAQAPQKKK
jgi:thioredoxin-related protein